MKITIIRPPVLMPKFNLADMVVPPLGPAYIAAVLRQEEHDVQFIDAVGLAIEKYTKHKGETLLHGLTLEEVIDRIPKDSQCIGISVQFSFEWPVCRTLVQKIRQAFPRALLIAGGEHVTALPEFSLTHSPLDIIVLGEGETTAGKILKAYQERGLSGLKEIPGICFRAGNGECFRTEPGKRIEQLEKIPYPAWDLLPIEEYLSRGYGFGVNRGRSIPVLASRGCPYQCAFCSNHLMWAGHWKARDPNDLLDEIAYLQKTYRVRNFDFYDLTVIVQKQWILDFCRAIEQRKMDFIWQLPSGTRSEAIDQEVLRLLYKTGCRNISYAPESGSLETLQKIKKRISLPRMMNSMKQAVKQGLNVKSNFIFGFPHEKWRHILQSTRAILKCALIGVHDLSVWVFVPYPGSELFNDLRSQGAIAELDDKYFFRLASYADISKTFSYCQALNRTKLLYSRTIATLLFYGLSWLTHPWRPFRMTYNALSGKMESRSELALKGLIKRLRKT